MTASKRAKRAHQTPDAGESAVDAATLSGCCAGDREAQRRLYEATHLRVYRLMVRIVGVQDAGDVTQQVFLQLFQKIDQFSGQSSFETWLYRLATNEALQHLRKGRRWNFLPLIDEPANQGRRASEQVEQRDMLERAFGNLEPELRLVFVLREVDGLSYADIAEAMGIPEGTVGSRLNRARRELQNHLASFGWTP